MSSLPDYELPLKRDKTILEEYTIEEKVTRIKPEQKPTDEPADWEKLNKKREAIPDGQTSLIIGSGKKQGRASFSF